MTELKTHAQVRGERNCPTCRGTGVRDCSGSILYDNDGMVRSSSSATTPCHCAKATPAVLDDVAQAAERVAQYLSRRKKSRGDDPEEIHGYDVSPEGGFPLRASDLETLIRAALNPTGD